MTSFSLLVLLLLLPVSTGGNVIPYPDAPLCADHETGVFHTLWNQQEGCHYDHEHGTSPFTADMGATFPGFDLFTLLGEVQISHTNPSSPAENTTKHGGFKWDVVLANPRGCQAGFEGAAWCVKSAAIQYHNFGDYSIEMEHSIHSTAALLKVCRPSAPSDCGYIYTVQHQEYGQRTAPYLGTVIPYPDSFQPPYGGGLGQYFTTDCIYPSLPNCKPSLSFINEAKANAVSIWTSIPTGAPFVNKVTGQPTRPPGSSLFRLLFRLRDTYQVLDSRDMSYPFTFAYVCGDMVYNPAGCRYNNSTSKVHNVHGTVPAAWDNLAGFDTNPVVGRITAEGYTDRFGTLSPVCSAQGGDCFPLKLVDMFVGVYGDAFSTAKVGTLNSTTNPERDLYFCSGVLCTETDPGAVPSGWIGADN